jgi:hypothetical protein
LREAEKPIALRLTRVLHADDAQARDLSRLVTVLPEEQRRVVLQEALTSARQIGTP